jgi:hypothetical protein
MSPLLTLMTPMMTAMTKQMKNKTSFGCTADNTSQLTMMMDLPRIKIRKTNHSARQVGMANAPLSSTDFRDIGFPVGNKSAYKCEQELTQIIRASKPNQEYSLEYYPQLGSTCTNMVLRGGGLGTMLEEIEQDTDQIEGTIENICIIQVFI